MIGLVQKIEGVMVKEKLKSNCFVFLFITGLGGFSSSVNAEFWVDEDGGALVQITKETLSILSIDNFYYFDQIFTSVRKENSPIRVCAGKNEEGITGRPNICISNLTAKYSMHNKGKVRALHIDTKENEGLIDLMKMTDQLLREGSIAKVSIDDGDLYAAYTLYEHYQLTPESHNILLLPD